MSGAIDIVSKKVIFQEDDTLEADSTIRFLKLIEKSYPDKKKVYVFCDNTRYYRNKKVQAYLEGSKVCMKFLSPYSPNLNPIERLWKLMNEQVINNQYYKEFSSFKNSVLEFLEKLYKPPEELLKLLKSRTTDNFKVFVTSNFFNSST